MAKLYIVAATSIDVARKAAVALSLPNIKLPTEFFKHGDSKGFMGNLEAAGENSRRVRAMSQHEEDVTIVSEFKPTFLDGAFSKLDLDDLIPEISTFIAEQVWIQQAAALPLACFKNMRANFAGKPAEAFIDLDEVKLHEIKYVG